jgi:methionyl-tRNA formyltransferase
VIRTAFFGTPAAAVPVVAALAGSTDLRLVVTRPDRPRGRSGRPDPPAVKRAAAEFGIPLAQPARPGEIGDVLRAAALDVAVVAAYGRIIPGSLLAVPARGFVNVHFSLLPRWRGASPVAHAILGGDGETGVTLMQMDEGLDTGPVLAAARTAIRSDDTTGTLTARLAHLGARLLADTLPALARGEIAATAQDDAAATTAPPLAGDDGHIDPHRPAAEVLRLVRAMHPWPGAWGTVAGERFKVLAAAPAGGGELPPGRIAADRDMVRLGTGGGSVELLTVQPAGKAAMSGRAWMNGRRGEPADLE